MPIPPVDLSRHFEHTTILASAGITVKGVTPEVTTCPFCRQNKLTIFLDPTVSIGTKWLYCSACLWRGDTIEAYNKLHNITDLKTGINKAIADGICSAPPGEISPDTVDKYIAGYPKRRRSAWHVWEYLVASFKHAPNPAVLHRIQMEHLWGGAQSNFYERMSRFLAAGTKTDIRKAFTHYYADNDVGTMREYYTAPGFKTALVLNYQDAVGRISAFQFLGEAPEEHYTHYCLPEGHSLKEGGLAMLDALSSFEDTVIAVGDPMVALYMHRRRLVESAEPLKLVCYNRDTKAAWRSVNARKVIFWAPDVSLALFQQARRATNAFVSLSPYYYTSTGKPHSLAHGPSKLFVDEIARHAMPWAEVFVTWITACSEVEATTALQQLNLSPIECDQLLSAATEEQHHRLKHLLGATERPRSANVGGTVVMEQGSTWMAARTTTQNELISDAVIKLEEELSDTDTGVSYLRGNILFRGQHIPFTDPTKDIEKDTGNWISVKTNKAGLGTPRLNKRFNKYLVEIARSFSSPRVSVVSSRLGLQSDRTIVFPKFLIMNGEIHAGRNGHPDPTAPMQKVMPPERRSADARDTTSLTRSALLAAFSLMLSNWLRIRREQLPLPIAVVGAPGCVARMGAKHLASTFGLHIFDMIHLRSPDLTELRSRFGAYGCLSWVNRSANVIREYPASNSDHVMLPVSVEELASLTVSSSPWYILQHTGVRPDNNPLPPVSDFIWYLADLQKRDLLVDQVDSFEPLAILKDLCVFLERYLDREQTLTVEQASQMLSRSESPGLQLIRMAAQFVRSGLTRLEHRRIEPGCGGGGISVVIDDITQEVFLSMRSLKAACRHLPDPDFGAATTDLAEKHWIALDTPLNSEGWIIPLSRWNEALKTPSQPT